MNYSDQAAAIREGEELDPVRVEAFLQVSVPGLEGPVIHPAVPRGFSNLTYLLSFKNRDLVTAPVALRNQGRNRP